MFPPKHISFFVSSLQVFWQKDFDEILSPSAKHVFNTVHVGGDQLEIHDVTTDLHNYTCILENDRGKADMTFGVTSTAGLSLAGSSHRVTALVAVVGGVLVMAGIYTGSC